MKSKIEKISGGFTLIEVIVTIVVLAILAAMMVPYFGTSFTHSGASISSLAKSQELNQVMEKISATYAQIPRWRKNTSFSSGTIILSTAASSIQGSFRSGGGTSGATEPSWNISAGATTPDNGITWTYIGPSPALTDLQICIGTEGQNYDDTHPAGTCLFGSYRVITNHFITFNSSNVEVACASTTTCTKYGAYLKVNIGFRSDDPAKTEETLTTMFVLR